MRDADRRLRLVDVLAAGAARAKHVDAQIRRIQLDLDIVVDLRRHEHGGERRVPSVSRIERRLAHEAVHAELGAQPAVRILAAHVNRRALDARNLAGRLLEHVDGVAVPLGPLQIHAQQHRRPVLRLGAALAGLDVEERVVRVHLAREHAAELEYLELLRHVLHLADDVVERARVLLLGARARGAHRPRRATSRRDSVSRRRLRARRARVLNSGRARGRTRRRDFPARG